MCLLITWTLCVMYLRGTFWTLSNLSTRMQGLVMGSRADPTLVQVPISSFLGQRMWQNDFTAWLLSRQLLPVLQSSLPRLPLSQNYNFLYHWCFRCQCQPLPARPAWHGCSAYIARLSCSCHPCLLPACLRQQHCCIFPSVCCSPLSTAITATTITGHHQPAGNTASTEQDWQGKMSPMKEECLKTVEREVVTGQDWCGRWCKASFTCLYSWLSGWMV